MEVEPRDACFGAGSVAGTVIGTFLVTILLITIAALLYRQWRKHKGKHLVLVTDPEIVEDAYAFDNPCFKDATPSVSRILERSIPAVTTSTPAKDSPRWSAAWAPFTLGSAERNDKRKILDDSCLGPKATRVNLVSLRSRDFTGLGFNVCGNMREGIFIKDLLHRGPASESGRIYPGDRIASVKISFRNMVYEDALTILSYASPYDVELEVESGGSGSKPTTLLKRSVGPSAARICHPLYRSQSIPELSQAPRSATRLFIADPNETIGSNYSTMNSTLKSSKSTSASQTLERRPELGKNSQQHHKFGIKVLPALDGTVHRIENQNEHNTNLERRHSKKMSADKQVGVGPSVSDEGDKQKTKENLQRRENPQEPFVSMKKESFELNGVNPEKGEKAAMQFINIPSEVPTEVHNAAMAARKNRRNSSELLNTEKSPGADASEVDGPKSPQKNKRKAPAPPQTVSPQVAEPASPARKEPSLTNGYDQKKEDAIDSITDYAESLTDYVTKARETADEGNRSRRQRTENSAGDRNSESDTDSEIQNSFTTIELNSSDITIHRTPVPEANEDKDDVYRKAESLGDLSKYECKSSATLERAQSLDMTDTSSKKRKAPLPPEDINESIEELNKLDQIDSFDRRKLKKSDEWGTLEDVVWSKKDDTEDRAKKWRRRKKSNGTLERSKSAVDIKLKDEVSESKEAPKEDDTSIELYNLPLSKRLTQEFIHAERMFNPDEDNSLAMIVNDGTIVKGPTLKEVDLNFRHVTVLKNEFDDEPSSNSRETHSNEDFDRALRYFEMHSSKPPNSPVSKNGSEKRLFSAKVHGEGDEHSGFRVSRTNLEETEKVVSPPVKSTSPLPTTDIVGISNDKLDRENDDDEDEYEFGSGVTTNSKRLSDRVDRRNINNISVSSGENSEDSGLVGESMDYNSQEFENRPPLPSTPMPRKMTYITEIKVPATKEIHQEPDSENDEIISIMGNKETQNKITQREIKVTSNGTSASKKPPVPPRRSDITKLSKEDADKQYVYTSEYKSTGSKETDSLHANQDGKPAEIGSKKSEQWIFVGDREQNKWGRVSSQPQIITNIVLSSGDEKNAPQ